MKGPARAWRCPWVGPRSPQWSVAPSDAAFLELNERCDSWELLHRNLRGAWNKQLDEQTNARVRVSHLCAELKTLPTEKMGKCFSYFSPYSLRYLSLYMFGTCFALSCSLVLLSSHLQFSCLNYLKIHRIYVFGLQIPVYVVLTLKNFESLFNIQRSYLTQTAYFKVVNKVQIGFFVAYRSEEVSFYIANVSSYFTWLIIL